MISLNGFTPEQLADIEAELRLGWMQKAVMAEHRRRAVAEVNKQETVWRDDWRVTMRMDPLVALYWKRREGAEVWEDSSHLKYFRKHFPEVFTKQVSGKVQVGYGTGKGSEHRVASSEHAGRQKAGAESGLVDKTGRALAAA